MFNQLLLKNLLVEYKKNFIPKHWAEEKYKWEAVKWFQDNWDINAKDFPEMLNRALDKTYNLLAAPYKRPKEMIVDLAKAAPEEVRSMFIDLFNEESNIFERIKTFKNRSDTLFEKYGGRERGHYQNENYISTYIWLRYPDKYYIYKYSEVKRIAEALGSDCSFKMGAHADNLQNQQRLYDEINAFIKEDTELVNLFRSQLTEACYPDPELKTLTEDVCFYNSITTNQTELEAKDATTSGKDGEAVHYWIYSVSTTPENWEKQEYNTGAPSVIFWNSISDLKYVGSADNMKPGDIVFAAVKARNQILGRGVVLPDDIDLSDIGGYYCDASYRRVHNWAPLPLPESIAHKRIIKWTHKGSCPCPCDFPARERLIDITANKDYVEELNAIFKEKENDGNKKEAEAIHYWIYSPGVVPKFWNKIYNSGTFMIRWNTVSDLNNIDDANDMKPGDIVFVTRKTPHKIMGRGVVLPDLSGVDKYYCDTGSWDYKLTSERPQKSIDSYRVIKWTHNADLQCPAQLPDYRKLTDITANKDYVEKLNALFNEQEKDENKKEAELMQQFKGYRNPFSDMLIESKNLIFRGAPGTGKSYLAKEIAADIISNGKAANYTELTEEQKKQVEFVQFHPSYDYSDFVEGLRPKLNDDGTMGFELQDGIFKSFIARARKNYEDSQKSKETIGRELSVQEAMMEFFSDIEFGKDTFKTITGNEFSITGVDDKHINISIPGNATVNKLSLNVDEVRKMLESDIQFTKIKDITAFFGKTFATQSYSYDFAIYNAVKSKKTEASKASAKQEELKKYIFIIDEINRGEISKIFGELFFAIDPDYRGRSGEISTQYANIHADPDEKFYIPENVYIIGTMNDIDKSVDSFDFAMRRRFRFVELRANERIEMLDSLENEELKNEAIRRMSALNKAITEVEDLNENYQIGAAYFLKLKTLHPDTLWRDHLQPLLREYVRGIEDEEGHMSKFAKAYDDYQDPNKDDADEDIKD